MTGEATNPNAEPPGQQHAAQPLIGLEDNAQEEKDQTLKAKPDPALDIVEKPGAGQDELIEARNTPTVQPSGVSVEEQIQEQPTLVLNRKIVGGNQPMPIEVGGVAVADGPLVTVTAAASDALGPASQKIPLKEAVESLTVGTEKPERNAILGRILIEEPDPAERERLIKLAAKRTRISFKALRASAEAQQVEATRREETVNDSLPAPEKVDGAKRKKHCEENDAAVESVLAKVGTRLELRAQTWTGGELIYICNFGHAGMLVLSSDGRVLPVAALPPDRAVQVPPDGSPISGQGVNAYRKGDIVSADKLFTEIREFIGAHAVLKHNAAYAVLAIWVMATYCYSVFNYFPYVWINSLGPSHGKSLLAKILSALAFNATAPQIDPTPASIFRLVDANGSTLILDEMEHLDAGDKRELMALLNAGFERGGQVPRAIPVNKGGGVKTYEVYSPKVVAGISLIPRVLRTRVFLFDVPKRKENESIKAFKPDRLGKWSAEVRDHLSIFALRNAEAIAEFYEQRDTLMGASNPERGAQANNAETCWPSMDDRLADIVAPLAVVAAVIDRDAGDRVATPALVSFATVQAGLRAAEEPADYALAVHALSNWAKPRWDSNGAVLINTKDAVSMFSAAEIEGAAKPAQVKPLLRKLGGVNKVAWWQGGAQRGYVFEKARLEDLVERYPLPQNARPPAEDKA